MRDALSAAAACPFNGVVVNVYDKPGGQIKWHDDGEASVGPVVASLSLGRPAVMGFRRKPKASKRNRRRRRGANAEASTADLLVDVRHNTLVIMEAGVQDAWQHCVFKPSASQVRATAAGPVVDVRINLTCHLHRAGGPAPVPVRETPPGPGARRGG